MVAPLTLIERKEGQSGLFESVQMVKLLMEPAECVEAKQCL